jgi:metallophosphoesterase superfamily enzyme
MRSPYLNRLTPNGVSDLLVSDIHPGKQYSFERHGIAPSVSFCIFKFKFDLRVVHYDSNMTRRGQVIA